MCPEIYGKRRSTYIFRQSLPGQVSEALRLIEDGQFSDAARLLGELLDINRTIRG
jgi:hypothetical protein